MLMSHERGWWRLLALACLALVLGGVRGALAEDKKPVDPPLQTDLSKIPWLGPQPDGTHKVMFIETTELVEDNLQPPFARIVDLFERIPQFRYDDAKRTLILNAPDEKLFGPHLIVDGKVAPALRCVVLRNFTYKGGVGGTEPTTRQILGVARLPHTIVMSEERRKQFLCPSDPRDLTGGLSIEVSGIGTDGTLRVSCAGKQWAVPPDKRLPLPSVSCVWPINAQLPYPHHSGRPGDLIAARLVLSIDLVYHGVADVDAGTGRKRDQAPPDQDKK